MRILLVVLPWAFLLSVFLPGTDAVVAGNREMVEKKITELDELNKKIVKKTVLEIPKEGVIQTRAKVLNKTGENKFKVIDQTVSPIEEKSIGMGSSSLRKKKDGGKKNNE
ncbi:MAG: hypothetical protein ACE5FU_11450 [Nitrospinota bacterium]